MTRKVKIRQANRRQLQPRTRRLLMACATALAVLLLLARLINFAHGRR
jgi:hypothetical protein